jgi:hypothetical protein
MITIVSDMGQMPVPNYGTAMKQREEEASSHLPRRKTNASINMTSSTEVLVLRQFQFLKHSGIAVKHSESLRLSTLSFVQDFKELEITGSGSGGTSSF